ncbi:DNA mismatch repair endonuclease MutL [Oceanobacillus neutriphilus]|uniref:DNA mismatch repair protein MutL n=1 Tax=Oceanobacillus neutriphilus TaxID=531815 RepID=A0ABQ2NWQ0_9BACI|nr:DNA mismatch repair endonuclease MutL [Oceanobacillus neutriphilus]GGP12515.1 DNA mismatch repair protein MutL [Oceanobacillus neutriphilus]
MPILQMPDSLANKIAAGEVVERPASVVKEIMENSIDAGATWIRIDVHEAGLSEIRIVDNGSGIAAEDVEKAFLPHATSKISTETDLFHVKTLGFRGEALASIASVSRLSIQTSEGSSAGVSLELEGGEVVKRGKSDARQGTEIVVRDLFYNTPARLKYMKSLHTELGHISDVLNRMGLAHPEIRIEATHNGKGLLKTSGNNDMLQVISQVYGMSVAKQMSPVEYRTLDFTITGYIAKPEVTRASRNYMSTIINGRFVRNVAINKAIIEGYHTLLPIGRSPIVVLSIEMDSILVDVNVHPAKLEVRFSKEKELYAAVRDMIQSHFRKMILIPEVTKKPEPKEKSEQHSFQFETEPVNPFQENRKNIDFEKSDPVIKEENPFQKEESAYLRDENKDIEMSLEEHEPTINQEAGASEKPLKDISDPIETGERPVQHPRVPMMYPIGQLQGTYIMAQNENGLYMVDQHAAQERVKYEFFKNKLGQPINESQELLIPMTFDFSRKEAIFIEEAKDTLEKAGLFFEPFGSQTYVIRSHPTWFPTGFEEEIIREMVDQFIQESTVNVEKIREDAAILMSCKRSIKANHYLTNEEMFQLLEDLRSTTDPFTCPHGRPIIVHFSTYELEKMFKRIM